MLGQAICHNKQGFCKCLSFLSKQPCFATASSRTLRLHPTPRLASIHVHVHALSTHSLQTPSRVQALEVQQLAALQVNGGDVLLDCTLLGRIVAESILMPHPMAPPALLHHHPLSTPARTARNDTRHMAQQAHTRHDDIAALSAAGWPFAAGGDAHGCGEAAQASSWAGVGRYRAAQNASRVV